MQLHQHTGQGGELLSSRLESFSLLLLLPSAVVLLGSRRPLGPKSAFMENTLQITSLTSPKTLNAAFLDLLSFRSG